MPETQTPRRVNTTTLFVTGTLCVLFGLLILSQRLGFAEIFLGAHSMFGLPLTNADALKLLAVSWGSVILVLQGLVILACGLVHLSRNNARLGASPERSATSA